MISNVNIAPFVGDKWVVIRLQSGDWEIPGGTLEPNETYAEAIRRELLEEAGARLKSFKLVGAWHCISEASTPYRPHLPFPEFYRVVGVGEIELVQAPENPQGGEQVTAVECDTLNGVMKRFGSIGRYDLKDLYQLAAELK